MGEEILRVKGLKTGFYAGESFSLAVNDVSFALYPSETLGLVGESGCGKSVTALSIMRLVPLPAGRIVEGEILFSGRDLLTLDEEEMRSIRGREISMIFQEPMTSLNPVFTVGRQLVEVFETHFDLKGTEAREAATELMTRVGLPNPRRRFSEYPHQMSGGMRQRVLIAMALAGSPKVLIADEPTTALDVTIQAQILALINELRDELSMGTLMISHDLGVISETAHRVAVMYAGRIVERAPVAVIFKEPYHPYTTGLMNSLPTVAGKTGGDRHLSVIPGSVPDPSSMPPGCPFEPRCFRRREICKEMDPPDEQKGDDHYARCLIPP
jgi:oligopeptide/dipeptide ABC transporter ATP-binding protein